MKKLFMANTVFGPEFAHIFLNYHLKCLLDETNVPACADRVEYAVYTDEDTLPLINAHKNFQQLAEMIPVQFFKFSWPNGCNRGLERYRVLIGTFRMMVNYALKSGLNLSPFVADTFLAKKCIPKYLVLLDEGYDAVIGAPIRLTFETMAKELDKYKGAPSAMELFGLGYQNMHPPWIAAHWDSPQFTKIPYTLLWNSGTGLLVRSFAVSPIAFAPDSRMVSLASDIDGELPSLFKNPFYAEEWLDSPTASLNPLNCFFPCYRNAKATTSWVKDWSRRTIHGSQIQHLNRRFFYPSKESANFPSEVILESDRIVNEIAL